MNNAALLQRVEYIFRRNNAIVASSSEDYEYKQYDVRACDNDVVAILRDLPAPFGIGKIDFLHIKENLYTYRQHRAPPPIPILKNIYWSAKNTERWNIPNLYAQSQTK